MVRVFGQTAVVNIAALMANYAFTAVMLTLSTNSCTRAGSRCSLR